MAPLLRLTFLLFSVYPDITVLEQRSSALIQDLQYYNLSQKLQVKFQVSVRVVPATKK